MFHSSGRKTTLRSYQALPIRTNQCEFSFWWSPMEQRFLTGVSVIHLAERNVYTLSRLVIKEGKLFQNLLVQRRLIVILKWEIWERSEILNNLETKRSIVKRLKAFKKFSFPILSFEFCFMGWNFAKSLFLRWECESDIFPTNSSKFIWKIENLEMRKKNSKNNKSRIISVCNCFDLFLFLFCYIMDKHSISF